MIIQSIISKVLMLMGLVFLIAQCDTTGPTETYSSGDVKVLPIKQLYKAKTYRSLDKALQKPFEVYKLILFSKGLKEVPALVTQLQYLNSFEISKNKICRLPGKMDALYSLQRMYLNQNEFDKIPEICANEGRAKLA